MTETNKDNSTQQIFNLICEIQGGPKSKLKTFVYIFAKYGPIFNFFSPEHSVDVRGRLRSLAPLRHIRH